MDELVFVSYASPDRDRVLPFYDHLKAQGFNTWIDCRNLMPGQNWDFEIKRALGKATFVIAFISKNSYDRRGYVQRELKLALDKATEKLIDDIYLIPVLLDDDVEVPEQLRDIQSISESSADCRERLVGALNHQLTRIGVERAKTQERERTSWKKWTVRESWEGLPGYEVELEFIDFQSDEYPNIGEVGDYIKGWLLPRLFEHRAQKIDRPMDMFNWGQARSMRTSTFGARCGEPTFLGKVLSIQYVLDTFGAGAAHPNYGFRTFNFLLDPLFPIASLKQLFMDTDAALRAIQDESRAQLIDRLDRLLGGEGKITDEKVGREWLEGGTEKWEDFSAFVFTPETLHILFPPYAVAAYALGDQFVDIPYGKIAPLMRPEYVSAMYLHRFDRGRPGF